MIPDLSLIKLQPGQRLIYAGVFAAFSLMNVSTLAELRYVTEDSEGKRRELHLYMSVSKEEYRSLLQQRLVLSGDPEFL